MSAIVQTVFQDSKRSRQFTVLKQDQYHEVYVSRAEEQKTERHLLFIMPDVSGSMFDSTVMGSSTIDYLMKDLQAVAARAVAVEHDVVLAPWAQDSALWVVTPENVTTVFRDSIDEVRIRLHISSIRAGHAATNPNDFTDPIWYGATFPKLGFERLVQYLNTCTVRPANVTILFGTDGAFSVPFGAYQPDMKKVLTDEYLHALGNQLIEFGIPMTMVYLGIVRDNVPDAQKILSVFPSTRYVYARDRYVIADVFRDQISAMVEEIANPNSSAVYLVVDSVPKFTVIDEMSNLTCGELAIKDCEVLSTTEIVNLVYFNMRKNIYEIHQALESAKASYLRGESIADVLLKNDAALSAHLRAIATSGGSGSDKNRTRQYLYAVIRFKNQLQRVAATEIHKDQLKDARFVLSKQTELNLQSGRFGVTIAKQISRNASNQKKYESVDTVVTRDANTRVTYVNTVHFEDTKQTHEYRTADVPAAIADSEEVDFITSESWKDVYASGDCMGQCIVIESRPQETQFHSPSRLHVRATMGQMSVQTIYYAIEQRVEVEGFDSLFDRLFTAMTSEDKYNAVLPTWSPNFNLVVKYQLKPLIGYLVGGHELAYPSRTADIYIPACKSLWEQYFTNGSSKTLRDAMLLTLAFRKAKQFTKLGNMLDSKAVTAESNLALFIGGDSGTHAFMSWWEPVLYSLLCDLDEEQSKTFHERLFAEQTYHVANKKWRESMYVEIVRPLALEIIELANLQERPDFTELAIDPSKYAASETIMAILKKFHSKAPGLLPSTAKFLQIGKLLNKEVWKHVETEYDIPETLNASLRAVLDAEDHPTNVKSTVENIAVANEFPSNSTRRVLTVTAESVLCTVVKKILVEEMGAVIKRQYYKTRFESIDDTHAGLPLIFTAGDAEYFSSDSFTSSTLDAFRAEFRRRFAMQLQFEALQFPLQDYGAALDRNLEQLWNRRADLGRVALTCTDLPSRRCAHALCPQFLKYDASVETIHWVKMGSDLSRQTEFRTWVPAMHLTMRQSIHRSREAFVNEMMRYALQFIHADFSEKFRSYFEAHYTLFGAK